jgi:signal transduction histidine kinase
VVLTLGGCFGVVAYGWLAADLAERVDAQAHHEAEEVGHVVASARTEEEVFARKSVFAGLYPEEGVLSLEVWTLDGRLVFNLPEGAAPPFGAWPEGLKAALQEGVKPLTSVTGVDDEGACPARRTVHRVTYGNEPRWLVSATVSSRSLAATLARFTWTYLLVLALASVLVFLGSLLLVTRALSPVQELTHDANTIVREGPGQRLVEPAPGSELHELVVLINRMLEKNEKTVEQLRRFASYAGHELRTPLTRIRAEAELALQADDPETARGCLASVLEETDELRRVVDALLELARGDVADLRQEAVLPLDTLLEELLEQARVVGAGREVRIESSLDGALRVNGSRPLLGRALWNLIDNAVKFAPGGGLVKVTARELDGDLEVEVTDDGPGLPPGKDPELFFEPFETGDTEQRGHGLGLSLSRLIARRHGGDVVTRPAATGACFVLRLPRCEATPLEPTRSRA